MPNAIYQLIYIFALIFTGIMYDYIKGNLVEKNPAFAVLETAGIGYMIYISLNTYPHLIDGKEEKLYVHQIVREDAQILFGFYDRSERVLFRHLISVSGIGPNTAILLLSSMSPAELVKVITTAQTDRLKTIKGIGGKTAERIIVDLRDKLDKVETSAEKFIIPHNTKKEEALTGLTVLGFSRKAAEKAVDAAWRKLSQLPGEPGSPGVDDLIKEALKNF